MNVIQASSETVSVIDERASKLEEDKSINMSQSNANKAASQNIAPSAKVEAANNKPIPPPSSHLASEDVSQHPSAQGIDSMEFQVKVVKASLDSRLELSQIPSHEEASPQPMLLNDNEPSPEQNDYLNLRMQSTEDFINDEIKMLTGNLDVFARRKNEKLTKEQKLAMLEQNCTSNHKKQSESLVLQSHKTMVEGSGDPTKKKEEANNRPLTANQVGKQQKSNFVARVSNLTNVQEWISQLDNINSITDGLTEKEKQELLENFSPTPQLNKGVFNNNGNEPDTSLKKRKEEGEKSTDDKYAFYKHMQTGRKGSKGGGSNYASSAARSMSPNKKL